MARKKRKRCDRCGKLCYNAASAYHAALASSRTFGGGFRIYPCPVNRHDFHVTGKKKWRGRNAD